MIALLRNPSGLIGAVLVTVVATAALLSLVWTPSDPLAVDPTASWLAPSAAHLLGTDALGRDSFSALLVGAQVTLGSALLATTVAAILGLPLAAFIELTPSVVSSFLQRFIDIMIAFPTLILAVILVTSFGSSTWTAAIAVGLGASVVVARTVAPELRRAHASDYSLLALAAGASSGRIMLHHVIPNAGSTIIVRLTQVLAGAALAEAGLSYLGFGTPAPTPSWGRTLAEMQPQIMTRPEVLLAPALCIVIVVLGFNLLGDGLRDTLDPRTRRSNR
ncbi:ABC transporter permease [Cryobacterium sp. Y57]|uniref:ABC transporter permease n=1 Tax=Cryobacterium sp. Y57 TaxID=2048287 RepID=UPI000CE4A7C3|nr:ABC transporter permease [Cryobacterium sp. Y57]